jgi:hypothetical protein
MDFALLALAVVAALFVLTVLVPIATFLRTRKAADDIKRLEGRLDTLEVEVRRVQLAARRGATAVEHAPAPPQPSPVIEGHEGDDYTRYELLAPDSSQFKITYEVTATRPGARHYFNIIRKGSEASGEAVFDQMTGQPLPWKVVTGSEARAAG